MSKEAWAAIAVLICWIACVAFGIALVRGWYGI